MKKFYTSQVDCTYTITKLQLKRAQYNQITKFSRKINFILELRMLLPVNGKKQKKVLWQQGKPWNIAFVLIIQTESDSWEGLRQDTGMRGLFMDIEGLN